MSVPPRGRLLPHDDTLPDADHHGADDARQQQVVREVQPPAQQQRRVQRLDRLGIRVDQPREHVHKARRIERRQHRARAETAAEDQHGDQHQRNVEHVTERTDLDRREDVMQHDTHAVDPARHELVGIDEEHEPRAHDRAAEENQKPRAPPRPRAHRFEQSLCVHIVVRLSGKDSASREQRRIYPSYAEAPPVQAEIYLAKILNSPEMQAPGQEFSAARSISEIFYYICMNNQQPRKR